MLSLMKHTKSRLSFGTGHGSVHGSILIWGRTGESSELWPYYAPPIWLSAMLCLIQEPGL
jgi:hypothetical protein